MFELGRNMRSMYIVVSSGESILMRYDDDGGRCNDCSYMTVESIVHSFTLTHTTKVTRNWSLLEEQESKYGALETHTSSM